MIFLFIYRKTPHIVSRTNRTFFFLSGRAVWDTMYDSVFINRIFGSLLTQIRPQGSFFLKFFPFFSGLYNTGIVCKNIIKKSILTNLSMLKIIVEHKLDFSIRPRQYMWGLPVFFLNKTINF
jgi:hypothetical protein